MGCRPDNAEPRNGCNDAADDKATACHDVVPGLLQNLSRALAGDVDLKVRARIDINCGLVSCTSWSSDSAAGRYVESTSSICCSVGRSPCSTEMPFMMIWTSALSPSQRGSSGAGLVLVFMR